MGEPQPFRFYTERRMVALTGLDASNLEQLVHHLRDVSGSSIFYHTHHLYLSHHFEKRRFYNDFANWVHDSLQESRLAEELAAIDLLAFTTIRELREAIVARIESHIERRKTLAMRNVPEGNEFHFCRSKSFVMPTGLEATDVPDLFAKLPQVSNVSLYFHFFEARLRLGRPTNDFSQWLEQHGESRLAAKIDKLDPYFMTLDELKQKIVAIGQQARRN